MWRRAQGYVRLAAAWAETENMGHVMELVREATELSEGGDEVEVQDRVRWATGSLVGEKGRGNLRGWRPLGVGM